MVAPRGMFKNASRVASRFSSVTRRGEEPRAAMGTLSLRAPKLIGRRES